MSRPPILKPGEPYTFSRYFELPFHPRDILAELGCSFELLDLPLPRYSGNLDWLALQRQLEQDLTIVDLLTEAARREVLIAPVLLSICRLAPAKLNIEYPIAVSEQLKGNLDYYLQAQQNLLVVEAKNADLAKGFTQLAVELIAMDQWTTLDSPILCGAVTTGDIWKFGQLARQTRQIQQDINLYRLPADLEELMRIVLGILGGEQQRAIA